VVSYFLRYFSSTSTEQISPDSAGPFTSFDPVGFAIFATHAVIAQPSAFGGAKLRNPYSRLVLQCGLSKGLIGYERITQDVQVLGSSQNLRPLSEIGIGVGRFQRL
jgi:hypothetical protein